MAVCSECNLLLEGDDAKKPVVCCVCDKSFHLKCTGIKSRSDKRDAWKCKLCLFDPCMLLQLVTQNSEILAKVTNIECNLKSALEEIQHLKGEVEVNKNAIAAVKEENMNLKEEIFMLNRRLEDMEQRSRISNVEIVGVPVTKNENVEYLVETIAKNLDIVVNTGDILIAHRTRSFNRDVPPNIVVNLRDRGLKNEWIRRFRSYKTSHDNSPFTANVIHNSFPTKNVYFNEHLTPSNKKLFSAVKAFAKHNNYQYTWVVDGKIKLRKNNTSKVFWIRCQDDIPISTSDAKQKQ